MDSNGAAVDPNASETVQANADATDGVSNEVAQGGSSSGADASVVGDARDNPVGVCASTPSGILVEAVGIKPEERRVFREVHRRATAFGAALATGLATIVVPGLRGNAPGAMVNLAEAFSHAITGIVWASLLLLVVRELNGVSIARPSLRGRMGLAVAVGAMLVLSVLAVRERVQGPLPMGFAGLAVLIVAFSAAHTLKPVGTRAIAIVLGASALGAICHVGAWALASTASERADINMYIASKLMATFDVGLAAVAQVVGITWLGLRASWQRHVAVALGLSAALAVTWGASVGGAGDMPIAFTVLHTALSDAVGVPAPIGITALAVFLVPASVLLAAVASISRDSSCDATVTALSLALVARTAFDVPFRALAVTASALCLLAAAVSAGERASETENGQGLKGSSGGRPAPTDGPT